VDVRVHWLKPGVSSHNQKKKVLKF